MASARGNNNDDSLTEYEQQKLANIEKNKRRLEALNIPTIVDSMVQQCRPRKRLKKVCNTRIATEPRNLRPRPQRNSSQLEEHMVPDMHPAGDFLENNEDHDNGNLRNGTQQEKKGRGITKKEAIFSRTPDMPKLTILLNDRGQPVGKKAREFSSVIGCQVRKKLSIACLDWRLVDAEKKYELWKQLKTYYDLDDAVFNWVMRTAGRKWKEFKATIKELYFSEDLSPEDGVVGPDNRVPDEDWKFLFDYWMSPESQIRSAIAKANRAKLQVLHTSGSVSYACSEHDLAIKLGRPPRRDESFIKTHTRKNGAPTSQAEPIINQLREIVEARPELKDRTIQEGDAFAAVCGEKEPRGYVRVMGLGPTPQEIGTPGLRSYTPTRLQMEILARKKAETEKAALEKRLDQLQARMDLMEQRAQQDRGSAEPVSQNGSTSLLHGNARVDEIGDAGHDQDDGDYPSGDDDWYDEDYENISGQVNGAAPTRLASHITTTARSNGGVTRSEHEALVGKDVILYALLRSEQPVAKGTVVSTDPRVILGDQPLGNQFCEVIVTHVLKRSAILPRPYLNMDTMADAHMMSIAWPYKKLKVCNKAPRPRASGSGH